MCAERSAIAAAVAAGDGQIVAAAVVTGAEAPTPPCGMCLQTLVEFGGTSAVVVLMTLRKDRRCFLLADTGIAIKPTLEQKKDILQSAAGVARALGEPLPRVAVASAVRYPWPRFNITSSPLFSSSGCAVVCSRTPVLPR